MKAASLNHVYRLVWSHAKNTWTVVSEVARARGKKSALVKFDVSSSPSTVTGKLSHSAKMGLRICLGMFALSSHFANALPLDYVKDIGDAKFVLSNNNTTLDITQLTPKFKASFESFNIGANETVNLNQNAGFTALFMITGNEASQIAGKFNVSNLLFFINPNGVYFAGGSEVNVGSIVVSTLKMSDKDFESGNYRFTGTSNSSVVNNGVIKAKDEGFIVLLGKTVDNQGTLVANNGSVVLGSAQEATLDFFGNGLVKAKLSGDALEAVVKNSGTIQANGGFVQLATSARAAAINISGIVEANQLVERNGMIRLEGGDNAKVEVSGKLIAKGQDTTGGTIEVTGAQVALMSGALLDASGDKGGGTVLVGGDYQGKNDAVYNSQTAYVSSGATIKADAIKEGNGGKVIVWADSLTRYYGNISAQGATTAGNGGFVEVSGKQNLDFNGAVDVAAINGVGGTVLLDPENITLSNASQSPFADKETGKADIAFETPSPYGGTTTNVNVKSVSGFKELFLQATKDINVNNALTMTNAELGSVRLEAGNDINVNAAITSAPGGTVTLKADADNSGQGNITIAADITGSSGVKLSAVNITSTAGNINTTGNTKTGIAGNVDIKATGDIKFDSKTNINAFGTTLITKQGAPGSPGGNVNIEAQSLSMGGNINTTGSASANAAGNGGQGGSVNIKTVDNASVGDITTRSGDAGINAGSGNISGSGVVNISSEKGSIATGTINTNGGANGVGANVSLTALTGNVSAKDINTSGGVSRNNTIGMRAGSVEIQAGTPPNSSIRNSGNITVGDITTSGGAGNGINQPGGAAGSVNLITTQGNINMGAITAKSGQATGSAASGEAAKIFVQAGRAAADLNQETHITKNGNITMRGDIYTDSTAKDAVQLVAEGNFDNSANASITTGTDGRWTIYSYDPTNDTKGQKLLDTYEYKQYGTTFGGALLGTGNGFVHAVSPTVTATLTGSANKVFDGNNTVTDLTGLSVTTSGVIDGDMVTVSPITTATYDTAAVGAGKPISSTINNVVSITTNEGKQIFNPTAGTVDGYTVATSATASGSITAVPTTPTTPTTTGFASPRDDAGLGGLIGNNPALNTMTIVSLNPAAGDEEDLDAVACPVNEDSLGSTPILNSGVKLPDGVNSNCI